MTPQEKELLTTLLDRLKNAARQPKDPEADALIRQATTEQPDLPYYLVQTVLIQDLSLHQAQQRIADLEKQLADAQQAAKPTVGSFLGGLFGSRPPAQASGPAQAGPWTRSPQVAAAPPAQPYGQPGYAPQPGYGQQPMAGGLMGGGMGAGGGFLRSAAATAAGVAGGALLFEGISSLFGNHYAGGLMSGGMTPGLGESVVNNYYGSDAGGAGGGGDWSSDPGGAGGGGGDWSSGAGAGDGDSASYDPGSQDFSSDQDWGGGGGDWSSGDNNTSC
ncbi:MAG TPA: DUF2076 domain-containing protein [Stellaceae bacterium]|nr:DUF2076 domain-containing protein [Stellaceae bacterium]